jgi:hypothetical protein
MPVSYLGKPGRHTAFAGYSLLYSRLFLLQSASAEAGRILLGLLHGITRNLFYYQVLNTR